MCKVSGHHCSRPPRLQMSHRHSSKPRHYCSRPPRLQMSHRHSSKPRQVCSVFSNFQDLTLDLPLPVTNISSSPFFPLISVHCLETDVIPRHVHRFNVSPDGALPGNVWSTFVSSFNRNPLKSCFALMESSACYTWPEQVKKSFLALASETVCGAFSLTASFLLFQLTVSILLGINCF